MSSVLTLPNAAGVPSLGLPANIVKRDGRVVPFDLNRIENAVQKCFVSIGSAPGVPVPELSRQVGNIVAARWPEPTVEQVQDTVEMVLQAAGEYEAAKHYILYRHQHAQQRAGRPVPPEVRQAFDQAADYFPTALQQFQFYDKYARFNYDLGRRETWVETVDRAVAFLAELSANRLGAEVYERIRRAMLAMQAMTSMRLLAMAGEAARRDNVAIYNCSYMPVADLLAFSEALLISMAGCGVGYSVERRYVESLPRIRRQEEGAAPDRFVVPDTAEGWAEALSVGLHTWFDGRDITFDYSQLRPAGAPLRIKGGRSSGPEALRRMLTFVRARVLARQGTVLRPLDAHDLMCAVGGAAVSGGVRRCLPVGTRIHTARGAVPIEAMREGDTVMTAHGYKPVTGWLDQGVQDIIEIETECGTLFRCTPHHRVAVLSDVWGGHTFKYAHDLTVDDRLLFITHSIGGEQQSLALLPPKRDSDHSGSQIKQPVLDEKTAWFLGKFFTDGYVQVTAHDEHGKEGNTQLAIAFHRSETDQLEKSCNWLRDHGAHVDLHHYKGNWIRARSGNRQLARWIAQYKTPNEPLVIPEAIWRSPSSVRAAFVAGVMDGDGSFSDRPVTVCSTVYEGFARELTKLLATLGIISDVRIRRPKTAAGWKALWIVTVKDAIALENAERLIGEYTCGKWVRRKGKQAGYTVPGWMVKRDVPRKDWSKLWPAGRDANMNSATLTTLVEATHYVPVRIRSLRPVAADHTYDIEVRDGSMFVAEGLLVHNTAMISLFDFDDDEMRACKSGDFARDNQQRWNANNSAVWPEDLNQGQVIDAVREMARSGRGEPGIFSRIAAQRTRPARRALADFGCNPCVTGDTWVFTDEGPRQVHDLVACPHRTFVHGVAEPASGFVQTGIKPVLRLTTREGYTLRLTANHRVMAVPYLSANIERAEWIEAGRLQPGDRIMLHDHHLAEWGGKGTLAEGWAIGTLLGNDVVADGLSQTGVWDSRQEPMLDSVMLVTDQDLKARAGLPAGDIQCEYHFPVSPSDLGRLAARFGIRQDSQTITPLVEQASSSFYRGLLRYLFMTDGTVADNQADGVQVRLAHVDLELLRAAQRMLLRLGIVSSIRDSRPLDGKGGHAAADGRARLELVIANAALIRFEEIGFARLTTRKLLDSRLAGYVSAPNPERFAATVAAVEPDGVEPVFDCTVPGSHAFDANGLFVHNCGEVSLRPFAFCNLSIAVARVDDTFESLRDKVEVATLIGTIQSLATHFPHLRPEWRRNCEEERLLGVDVNGQMDSPVAQDAQVQRQLREVAVEVNRRTAEQLGINPSAAVTCVKPSGNSAVLFDCSSGLHARWSPYYIRNVRVAASSPLFKVLRDAGAPMDPENGQLASSADTWVVHFPVAAPAGAVTRRDRTALAQCEYWLQVKSHWTEHNPSVTITYQPDEEIDLLQWIWEHRGIIGGMTFFPADNAAYAQQPYVQITRQEYEQLAARFPAIDFAKVYRYEESDLTTTAQELACLAGVCDIDLAPPRA